MAAKSDRIGKLPPMYSLLLNPHAETRLSSCPHCNKPTYPRKFALFIHVEGYGPCIQGITCKYCSKCQMILVQQDELEAQLAYTAQQRFPKAVGEEYIILGVVELKTFKKGIRGDPTGIGDVLDHVSDIRKQYGLSLQLGGWYPKDKEPPILPAYRDQRIPRMGMTPNHG